MRRRLTAIIEREGDGHVALCPEVDVASQSRRNILPSASSRWVTPVPCSGPREDTSSREHRGVRFGPSSSPAARPASRGA